MEGGASATDAGSVGLGSAPRPSRPPKKKTCPAAVKFVFKYNPNRLDKNSL